MLTRALAILLCGLALAACAPLPLVKASVNRARADAPAPDLLPIDDLLAQAGRASSAEEAGAGLGGRVAALKTRAAAMRGPVTDAETRARLNRAIPAIPPLVASVAPSG